ncbi:hypothetical protein [Fervidobacterium sp. 2310opik-2]|uniref:hypothetical protein n=1 Tax=Fervidobacterium sp. 2310opik-2 TaxID=1755815 RepID=UPI0013DECBF1|nr:hypothetical protein [Fervidobacterium sp. 2310opik-2]KAF2962259.1 hypothetical protein AS161_04765 [Fervidobacterium sp. 2310opik-2]
MPNRKKPGFAVAIVLIFLTVASILLLIIYEVLANYRNNEIRMRLESQLEVDALNTLNVGIGMIRSKSAGILGFDIPFSPNSPSWFNSEFLNKLNNDWKQFVTKNVKANSVYKVISMTGNENYSIDPSVISEISNYKSERGLDSIEIYAFNMNKLNLFLVSRVVKNGNSTYSYGIVGSKLLNQYVYFTNKEKIPDGQTIYFKSGETIDGPLRTHDYININNVGGNPTFLSTIEIIGIKDKNGNVVQPSNYSNYANLLGNPPYKILTQEDINALDFNAIKSQYQSSINSLVDTYDNVKNNPNKLSGLKFTGDITVSFNHGQGNSNYDIKISQGNVDYIIKWEPSGPPLARIRKQGGGKPDEFVFNFNGVIYSTGNMTIGGQTSLSTYNGNYTLFSEKSVYIKDRIIPYKTYKKVFNASEHSPNGEVVTADKIEQIKDFVTSNETSALNIVAIKDVVIKEKLHNMKLFSSIFSFDGSFEVEGYDTDESVGQLFVFGSIMQNVRGPVGTFDPSTGQTVTGYYKTYSYDPRIITGAYQPYGTPTKSETIRLFVLGVVK